MPAVAMDMRAGGTDRREAEVRRRPGRPDDDNLEGNYLYNCPVINWEQRQRPASNDGSL